MGKKFFETKDFKKLQNEWSAKLKDSGFEDLEGEKEDLKHPNDRTIAFNNRDKILHFHRKLGIYLNDADQPAQIPDKDRQILELYMQGIHIKGADGIVEQTGWSDKTVRNLINKYKKIVLALPDEETDEGQP